METGMDSAARDLHGRREWREDVAEATVEIEGGAYSVENWSSGSFLARPCAFECAVGHTLDIRFSVLLAGRRLEFDCGAVVTRANPAEGELAGVFVYIDSAIQTAITHHFKSLAEQ